MNKLVISKTIATCFVFLTPLERHQLFSLFP